MHTNAHMYTEDHDNCRVRGGDEKRGDGVLWFSAHRSRKILAWEDMRIQNVDDYPGAIGTETVCAFVLVSAREGGEMREK